MLKYIQIFAMAIFCLTASLNANAVDCDDVSNETYIQNMCEHVLCKVGRVFLNQSANEVNCGNASVLPRGIALIMGYDAALMMSKSGESQYTGSYAGTEITVWANFQEEPVHIMCQNTFSIHVPLVGALDALCPPRE